MPGSGSSAPSELTNVAGTLFFGASEQGNNRLWKSDGTVTGTVALSTPRPFELTDVGGTLFFGAGDSTELWKSDGTPAGTTLIKRFDRHPPVSCGHTLCSIPSLKGLLAVDGKLYFVAYDDSSGFELWRSDGTEAGTTLVKDISPGVADSSPLRLTNLNGTLFFDANDGVNGRELWRSDGTAGGTTLVKDIFPGSGGAIDGPGYLVYDMLAGANGELLFAAIDPVHGRELWRSDGTAAGTTLVKDIMPGAVGANPHDLIQAGGRVLFAAADDAAGMEVWQTDGSAAGTTLVADIAPGTANANPSSFTLAGVHLFFSADDGAAGRELWAISSAGDVFV